MNFDFLKLSSPRHFFRRSSGNFSPRPDRDWRTLFIFFFLLNVLLLAAAGRSYWPAGEKLDLTEPPAVSRLDDKLLTEITELYENRTRQLENL